MFEAHVDNCPKCLSAQQCDELGALVNQYVAKTQTGMLAAAGSVKVKLFNHGSGSSVKNSLEVIKDGKPVYYTAEEAEAISLATNKWLHSED